MKYLLLLAVFPYFVHAGIISECGEYKAKGVVRLKQDRIKLIVNEKTLSEYEISMSLGEQTKLAGLIDRDVTVELILDQKLDGQKAESSEILSVASRIPNPLDPTDTGLTLVKNKKCAEKKSL